MALVLLPLQGLAASISEIACVSHDAHHALSPHAHAHHNPADQDSDTGGDRSSHLTCHHVFNGMPAIMTVDVPAELPAFESSISLLVTLHVPETPQTKNMIGHDQIARMKKGACLLNASRGTVVEVNATFVARLLIR